jgi:hypothetical protein
MTIEELISASAPFGSIEGDPAFLETYLIALLAEVNPDPNTLSTGMACWNCLSEVELIAIQNYLLCLLAGTLTCTADALAQQSLAYQQIQDVYLNWIQTYLLAVWAQTFS